MGVKFYGAPGATEKETLPSPVQSYIKIFRRSNPSNTMIKFINPESTMFRVTRMIKLVPGDTVGLICRMIAKNCKGLDPKTIKLYRFEDLKSERKIPVLDQPLKRKILIPDNAIFDVDLNTDKVFVVSNGTKHEIGRTVTYTTPPTLYFI